MIMIVWKMSYTREYESTKAIKTKEKIQDEESGDFPVFSIFPFDAFCFLEIWDTHTG